MNDALAGRRILLVEDEYFIVDDLARELIAAGAKVLGPVASVGEALSLISESGKIDGAILDLSLQRDELAYPVADALMARGVPFVITTGYGQASIASRYAALVRCEKPVPAGKVAQVLSTELKALAN